MQESAKASAEAAAKAEEEAKKAKEANEAKAGNEGGAGNEGKVDIKTNPEKVNTINTNLTTIKTDLT